MKYSCIVLIRFALHTPNQRDPHQIDEQHGNVDGMQAGHGSLTRGVAEWLGKGEAGDETATLYSLASNRRIQRPGQVTLLLGTNELTRRTAVAVACPA